MISVLRVVHDLPLPEVVDQIKSEKRAAEASWKQAPRLSERRNEMWDYTQSLRCLLFWLTRRKKPRNCKYFPAFRPLTESLVRRGSFPATILSAFEG